MNQRLMCASLILLACFCQAAQAGQELLKNPSFEEQGSDADVAADWNRWGPWINYETGWTPTHSGKGMIGYHHWQIESNDDSGIWQDVKVEPGKEYTFSVFVCCDDPGSDHGAKDVELRLEAPKGDSQQTIQSATTTCKEIGYGQWKKLQITGKASGDTLAC